MKNPGPLTKTPLAAPRFHISRPRPGPDFTLHARLRPPKFHISRAPAAPRFHISRAPAASQASHFTPAPPPQISHFTPRPPRFHISRPLRPPQISHFTSPCGLPPGFTFHVRSNNSRGRPVGPLILLPKKAQLRSKTASSSTTQKVEVLLKGEKRLNFAPKRHL